MSFEVFMSPLNWLKEQSYQDIGFILTLIFIVSYSSGMIDFVSEHRSVEGQLERIMKNIYCYCFLAIYFVVNERGALSFS